MYIEYTVLYTIYDIIYRGIQMIQVQKGFTPRFGALRSEPDGSTSLQRSQRVRSMEMDEVIRVKAKVVTSEGDLGRYYTTVDPKQWVDSRSVLGNKVKDMK